MWSRIDRVLEYVRSPWGTYYVLASADRDIHYSSLNFGYERFDEPRLATLRRRMKLDSIMGSARSDFDKINRIRHAVSQMWKYGSPEPAYPEWDALAILDRAQNMGSGGMCQQYAVALMEALAAVGYQSRHANLFAHETIEVFVPDLQKWVLADGELRPLSIPDHGRNADQLPGRTSLLPSRERVLPLPSHRLDDRTILASSGSGEDPSAPGLLHAVTSEREGATAAPACLVLQDYTPQQLPFDANTASGDAGEVKLAVERLRALV